MEHPIVESASGAEQRHLVRMTLAIDTDARLELAGPTGRVTTPAELIIHVKCSTAPVAEGAARWRACAGPVFLKEGRLALPAALTDPSGKPVHAEPMAAACALLREALAYLWPPGPDGPGRDPDGGATS